MAALRRAVALEEVHDVAVGVGEDLHLDVAAALDVLLDQHGVVAERARAPRAGRRPRASAYSAAPRTIRMPLPPPPAAALTSTG